MTSLIDRPRTETAPLRCRTVTTRATGVDVDSDPLAQSRDVPPGADRATATACSARASRPRTRCRRRWCARGGTSTASRAGRRCGRGSTASPPTSASTCCRAHSAGRGRWTSGRRRRPTPRCHAGLPESTWVQPVPDARMLPEDGDPAELADVPRDDPARLRRRAAAPAAQAAGRADPARGAALAGDRGGRAARHERRVGEQRAAAGPGHARRRRRRRARAAAGRRRAAGAARPLRRRVRALRHHVAGGAAARGRHVHDAAVRTVAARARSTSASGTSGRGAAAEGSRLVATSANGCPAFASYKPAGRRAAGSRSTSTSWRSQTAGSRAPPLPRTPSCSRSSASRPASTVGRRPARRRSSRSRSSSLALRTRYDQPERLAAELQAGQASTDLRLAPVAWPSDHCDREMCFVRRHFWVRRGSAPELTAASMSSRPAPSSYFVTSSRRRAR